MDNHTHMLLIQYHHGSSIDKPCYPHYVYPFSHPTPTLYTAQRGMLPSTSTTSTAIHSDSKKKLWVILHWQRLPIPIVVQPDTLPSIILSSMWPALPKSSAKTQQPYSAATPTAPVLWSNHRPTTRFSTFPLPEISRFRARHTPFAFN